MHISKLLVQALAMDDVIASSTGFLHSLALACPVVSLINSQQCNGYACRLLCPAVVDDHVDVHSLVGSHRIMLKPRYAS